MKGVIIKAIEELVKTNFGEEKWKDCLKAIGLDPNTLFLANDDIDDEVAVKFVKEILPRELNLTYEQVCDAFGEYWMTQFAPKVYKSYFIGAKGAKDFLLKMDRTHVDIGLGKPPRFSYEEVDKDTLIIHYTSHRQLIDIMVGLIKGVGKYFNEKLEVKKLSDKTVMVKFLGTV